MTNMISSKWLWLAVTAAILVWGELSAPVDVADRVGYMLRVTARLAFALLLIAYLARPLKQLGVEGTALRWVLRNRRQVGLSMALAHTVHFGYVVAYLQVSGEPLAVVTALFGGAAFVLMWLMGYVQQLVSGATWALLEAITYRRSALPVADIHADISVAGFDG